MSISKVRAESIAGLLCLHLPTNTSGDPGRQAEHNPVPSLLSIDEHAGVSGMSTPQRSQQSPFDTPVSGN